MPSAGKCILSGMPGNDWVAFSIESAGEKDDYGSSCVLSCRIIESLYPHTSFDVPVMNIAFEAAAAGASGVEAALRQQGRTDITVAAWAGDGGTCLILGFKRSPGLWSEALISSISVITIKSIPTQGFNGVEQPRLQHGLRQQLVGKPSFEKRWEKLSLHTTFHTQRKLVLAIRRISIAK